MNKYTSQSGHQQANLYSVLDKCILLHMSKLMWRCFLTSKLPVHKKIPSQWWPSESSQTLILDHIARETTLKQSTVTPVCNFGSRSFHIQQRICYRGCNVLSHAVFPHFSATLLDKSFTYFLTFEFMNLKRDFQ